MTALAINSLLEQEIALCKQLLTAMQAERELLEQHSFDGLQPLLQQKADLLSDLETCKQKRQAWRQQLGGNYTSLDQWLDSARAQTQDSAWLQSLDKTAFLLNKARSLQQECNALNSINGMIINKARRRARDHLDLLKGQSKSQPLYDASGNSVGGNSGPEPGQRA